jgi:glucose-6-phosphate-specific signal transduction histidine kinase
MTGWGLISEDEQTVSLGKAAFWVVLFISCGFWIKTDIKDFPPTLLTVLEVVMAYNFGKKGLDVITSTVAAITSSKETVAAITTAKAPVVNNTVVTK